MASYSTGGISVLYASVLPLSVALYVVTSLESTRLYGCVMSAKFSPDDGCSILPACLQLGFEAHQYLRAYSGRYERDTQPGEGVQQPDVTLVRDCLTALLRHYGPNSNKVRLLFDCRFARSVRYFK